VVLQERRPRGRLKKRPRPRPRRLPARRFRPPPSPRSTLYARAMAARVASPMPRLPASSEPSGLLASCDVSSLLAAPPTGVGAVPAQKLIGG
jgi:hypothetical protein